MKSAGKVLVPLGILSLLLALPVPDGLAPYAWRYQAIFVAVILEPLPGGAVGLIGVVAVTAFAQYVLFSPEEIPRPG